MVELLTLERSSPGQETFKQDLRREVQELKVLVGCMEAAVETAMEVATLVG